MGGFRGSGICGNKRLAWMILWWWDWAVSWVWGWICKHIHIIKVHGTKPTQILTLTIERVHVTLVKSGWIKMRGLCSCQLLVVTLLLFFKMSLLKKLEVGYMGFFGIILDNFTWIHNYLKIRDLVKNKSYMGILMAIKRWALVCFGWPAWPLCGLVTCVPCGLPALYLARVFVVTLHQPVTIASQELRRGQSPLWGKPKCQALVPCKLTYIYKAKSNL
jgi:hypothetical protein